MDNEKLKYPIGKFNKTANITNEHLGLYSWHCNHHLAHITEAKKRNNWK